MQDVNFRLIETNGIRLHTAIAGPVDGELVVLLHGFPEFSYGFHRQMEFLAANGYRVVAPDQRGYHLSDKPDRIEDYTIDKLSEDIAGLIKAFGETSAIVIGHDWGGAVAWHLAATKPNCVKKLVAINIPHPAAMPSVLLKNPLQWLKSSYMAFFQLPEVPEKLMAANGFESMKQAMKGTARPDAFTEQELERYKEAWSQPGALTGMLNWYRALQRQPHAGAENADRHAGAYPLGARRSVFDADAGNRKPEVLSGCRTCLDRRGDATHWVHHEQPAIVNRLIKEFLV